MQFVEQLHWRGSALAFPFGEGGPLAVEEVLPQYEFAERFRIIGTACCTSPAPFGGTLPKGEGFGCTINYNLNEMFLHLAKNSVLCYTKFIQI